MGSIYPISSKLGLIDPKVVLWFYPCLVFGGLLRVDFKIYGYSQNCIEEKKNDKTYSNDNTVDCLLNVKDFYACQIILYNVL